MHDSQNHIRSRVESIAVLVRQIAQWKDAPYEIAQFAASAVYQLAQLELHLNTLRDPATLNQRRTDRGYQPATLPHAQTVTIPTIVDPGKFMMDLSMPALQTDSKNLTFERAEKVLPDPPIGIR